MSRLIKLADNRNRWAHVRIEPPSAPEEVMYLNQDGRRVRPAIFIKSTKDTAYDALRGRYGDDGAMSQALIHGDPEIDLDAAGRRAGTTDRILLDPDGNALYAATAQEVIFSPDGREVERREPVNVESNINPDLPPIWSGRMVPRSEAARRFVFVHNYQVRHVDGLTFDFLFELAEMLERSDVMAVAGSGPKGTGPLYMERNGLPYRGFLEGRTRENQYLLILRLSNMELKRTAPGAGEEGAEQP